MPFTSPRRRSTTPPSRTTHRPRVERMEERALLTAAPAQVVTQLYQDLLRRLPDPGGLAFWSAQIDSGTPAPAVASALTHSAEFHGQQVDGVYRRLLGRGADDGGRAFFASALGAGTPLAQVEAAVAGSDEFRHLRGANASGFLATLFDEGDDAVGGLYRQILRRDPDPAGHAFWATQLDAGMQVGELATALATSAERQAMPTPNSTVLATFADDSALPIGAAGSLEASLAGAAHAALGINAQASGPQAVTLKNGLPGVFQAFGPQRLVDTRNPVAGQYGGPTPGANTTRTINVSPYNLADPSIPSPAIGDTAPTSNLPTGITAISVIIFIVGAPQAEYLTAYATGTSPAPINTATVFADHAGQIIAASAIVPVSAAGNIDIYTSGGGNYIVDVTGYFLNTLDGADYLPITGNVPGGGTSGVIVGTNNSTTTSARGVTGVVSATSPGSSSAGVRGINNGTNANGVGVFGSHAGSGEGVRGTAAGAGMGGNFTAGTGGTGVVGSTSGSASFGGDFTGETGLRGTTNGTITSYGVVGQVVDSTVAAGSAGVRGISASTNGTTYGVLGQVTDTAAANNSAGVRGTNATTNDGYGVIGVISSTAAGDISAGVRGTNATTNNGFGVIGVVTSSTVGNDSAGVRGINRGTNNFFASGVWGSVDGPGYGGYFSAGTGGYGVTGVASGAGSYGVFSEGNTGATGTKSFVDPNPIDPSKQIAYVSLEGPEAGTYFRGRGHITNGTATIDVPESFRLVTDPSGLTVQITPIGGLATFAAQSMDLNHVVVLGSQDLEFSYLVQGVRKGYQGYDPIQTNRAYLPRSADDTMPAWLTDTQRQTLIANGTYNADGTVNLTTAHNLGWDANWTTTTTSG